MYLDFLLAKRNEDLEILHLLAIQIIEQKNKGVCVMMINPLLTEFPLALYFLDLNGAAKEGVTTLKGVAKVTFTDLRCLACAFKSIEGLYQEF